MARVTRVASAGMRPYAVCQSDDCRAEWPMSPTTREDAKHHAKTNNHEVLVVTETRDLYRLEGVGALREVKADAWDECHKAHARYQAAMWSHIALRVDATEKPPEPKLPRNPYRDTAGEAQGG